MTQLIKNISGAILAGGDSSRIGEDKALLQLGDKKMIQHLADTFRSVFDKVVVIADREKAYKFLPLPIYPDIYKNFGPLAGIHSAIFHTKTDACFITACDTPNISSELIRIVIKNSYSSEVCVVKMHERIHTLCGLYSRSCMPVLDDCLSRNIRKVESFIQMCNHTFVSMEDVFPDDADMLLFNINTKADYHRTVEFFQSQKYSQ